MVAIDLGNWESAIFLAGVLLGAQITFSVGKAGFTLLGARVPWWNGNGKKKVLTTETTLELVAKDCVESKAILCGIRDRQISDSKAQDIFYKQFLKTQKAQRKEMETQTKALDEQTKVLKDIKEIMKDGNRGPR